MWSRSHCARHHSGARAAGPPSRRCSTTAGLWCPLLARHYRPFTLPNAGHPVTTDAQTTAAHRCGHLAIAVAARFASQTDNALGQHILVRSANRPAALRVWRLANYASGMTVRYCVTPHHRSFATTFSGLYCFFAILCPHSQVEHYDFRPGTEESSQVKAAPNNTRFCRADGFDVRDLAVRH